MTHVFCPVCAGDNDRGAIVRLDTAIKQMQRFADDPAAQHVIHRVIAACNTPLGLFDACSEWTTFTMATCSGLVPGNHTCAAV